MLKDPDTGFVYRDRTHKDDGEPQIDCSSPSISTAWVILDNFAALTLVLINGDVEFFQFPEDVVATGGIQLFRHNETGCVA